METAASPGVDFGLSAEKNKTWPGAAVSTFWNHSAIHSASVRNPSMQALSA